MKTKLLIAAVFAAASVPASASTALALGSGWQGDTLNVVGQPTTGSSWTFTVASGAHFSVVDCCRPGDTYTLSGGTTGATTFYAGSGVQADGSFFGNYWPDASFSKIDKYLGAGTYAISITGDGFGGLPAGLAVRLDSTVPEPATWVMALAGFGLVGFALRRRTTGMVAA